MLSFEELHGLASKTQARIKEQWPNSAVGSHLSWAAMNLGGAQAAVGMVESLASQERLAALRRSLSLNSSGALEAAAVALASRSAVSAIDLCVETAWLISNEPLSRGPVFNYVSTRESIKLKLLPDHQEWVDGVAQSDTWDLLSKCRNQAVHGTFQRTVKLNASGKDRIPLNDFEVGGEKYTADNLVKTFAQAAVGWFRDFCETTLAAAQVQ